MHMATITEYRHLWGFPALEGQQGFGEARHFWRREAAKTTLPADQALRPIHPCSHLHQAAPWRFGSHQRGQHSVGLCNPWSWHGCSAGCWSHPLGWLGLGGQQHKPFHQQQMSRATNLTFFFLAFLFPHSLIYFLTKQIMAPTMCLAICAGKEEVKQSPVNSTKVYWHLLCDRIRLGT